MADLDNMVKNIEGGNAWDETDEVVQVEVKKPLDKVIPIRLSADKWEELRQEARELGLGPTTLARMWIMERLRLRSIFGHSLYLSAMNPMGAFMPGLVPLGERSEMDIEASGSTMPILKPR